MFNISEKLLEQRAEYIKRFEKNLKEGSPKISQFDREQLESKIKKLNEDVKTALIVGGITSLFVAWNFRKLNTLSIPFKVFAFLTPAVAFPTYTYFSQMNKIYAYHTLLAVKYKDIL